MTKVKKPIYKRVWFLVLVGIVSLIILGSMFSDGETPTERADREIAKQQADLETSTEGEEPASLPSTEGEKEQVQPEKTATPEKTAVDPLTVNWNTKETDAFANGNIDKAVDLLLSMNNEDLSNLTYNDLAAKEVIKAPWNHYGQYLKISGYAIIGSLMVPGKPLQKECFHKIMKFIILNPSLS